MLIRCESCKRTYDFEPNDGLCPRCGCYNSLTHEQAYRLEAKREKQQTRLREQNTTSLCDAQDNRTFMAGRYAPDCMEDGHDPRHVHTGGANLDQDSTNGNAQKPAKKKSGCAIIGAILWFAFVLLQILSESLFVFSTKKRPAAHPVWGRRRALLLFYTFGKSVTARGKIPALRRPGR